MSERKKETSRPVAEVKFFLNVLKESFANHSNQSVVISTETGDVVKRLTKADKTQEE